MTYIVDFEMLEKELVTMSSRIETNLTTFPSGAADLGVHVVKRFFSIVYIPSQSGFGVDEGTGEGGFDMGYPYWFTDFTSARQKFLEMIHGALKYN